MAADSVESFLEVAQERGKDASILKEKGRLLAAVYMAGYAVECKLKALLQKQGKRFPIGGQEGHNLRGLWEAAGLKLHDIQGYRRLFIEVWTTTLRYEHSLPSDADFDTLYQGSVELAGYVQKQIRYAKGKKH